MTDNANHTPATPPQSEIIPPGDIIAPEQARLLLERAMAERLGADWRDEESGWILVTMHDYMARVTRGRTNVDFLVDLVGEVSVSQSEITTAQDSGRLLAWMFLLLALGIAFLLARIVGWL